MARIVGNELPTWTGPATARVGLILVATAALTSAVFLHCAFAFTGAPRRWYARDGYVFCASMTLLCWVILPGDYAPFAGTPVVATPNAVGWVTSIAWALLTAAGQIVLLHAFVTQTGKARRQTGAMIAASACGLVCMSGYAIAALRLPMLPWLPVGLPLYRAFLVYGNSATSCCSPMRGHDGRWCGPCWSASPAL